MTGIIAQLFADWREARKDDNPLVDLDTLSPLIPEPTRTFIETHRVMPNGLRRIQIFDIELLVWSGPRGPLIRLSAFEAVIARLSDMAIASEHVHRQEKAAIEAEDARYLAQSHAEFLRSLSPTDRGLLAARLAAKAEAEARVAQQYNDLLAQNEKLAAGAAALHAESVRQEVINKKSVALEGKLALEARANATRNNALQKQVNELAIQLSLLLVARNHFLARQKELKDENWQWRAQARGEARAAARARRERDVLREQVAALTAHKEELQHLNARLQDQLRAIRTMRAA
jgi:hypothetical protein